jgi:hypothetical protein
MSKLPTGQADGRLPEGATAVKTPFTCGWPTGRLARAEPRFRRGTQGQSTFAVIPRCTPVCAAPPRRSTGQSQ